MVFLSVIRRVSVGVCVFSVRDVLREPVDKSNLRVFSGVRWRDTVIIDVLFVVLVRLLLYLPGRGRSNFEPAV